MEGGFGASGKNYPGTLRVTQSLTGSRVLILSGSSEGDEGIVLDKADGRDMWRVAPDSSNKILDLEFRKDFALLFDGSGKKELN